MIIERAEARCEADGCSAVYDLTGVSVAYRVDTLRQHGWTSRYCQRHVPPPAQPADARAPWGKRGKTPRGGYCGEPECNGKYLLQLAEHERRFHGMAAGQITPLSHPRRQAPPPPPVL